MEARKPSLHRRAGRLDALRFASAKEPPSIALVKLEAAFTRRPVAAGFLGNSTKAAVERFRRDVDSTV
jgi:hypothetical protein